MSATSVNVKQGKILGATFAAIVFATAAIAIFIATNSLSVTRAADPAGTIDVSVGGEMRYDGTSTNLYSAGEIPAVSATPGATAPQSGSYQYYTTPSVSTSSAQMLRAIMYTSYMAPGFDASCWPSTDWNGAAMDYESYMTAAYIMVSNVYGNSAFSDSTDSAFKTWAQSVIDTYASKVDAKSMLVPNKFQVIEIDCGQGSPKLVSYLPGGLLTATVTSSDVRMVEDNPMYSFDGTEFLVYDNAACSGTTVGGISFVENNGNLQCNELFLSPGTYYIKQLSAGSGYSVSNKITKIQVANSATSTATLKVTPICNSTPFYIKVSDAQGATNGQADATLAGAQYTVSYYPVSGITSVSQLASETAAWSEDIVSAATGSGNYVASPTTSQIYAHGESGWPVGTYKVSASRASVGYQSDSNEYVFSISGTSSSAIGSSNMIVGSTVNGSTTITPQNPISSTESVSRGDITVSSSQDGSARSGVKYDIYNKSAAGFYNSGTLVNYDDLVCTIETDANGIATTPSTNPLPYGTYSVVEQGNTSNAVTTSISAQGQNRYVVMDNFGANVVKVQAVATQSKFDATTDTVVPTKFNAHGAMTFALYSVSGSTETPISFQVDGQTVSQFVTGPDGSLILPGRLSDGNYRIKQTAAPYGYTLSASPQTDVVISSSAGAGTYANPIEVEFNVTPVERQVQILDCDAETLKLIKLAGNGYKATYTITNIQPIYAADDTTVLFAANQFSKTVNITSQPDTELPQSGTGTSTPLPLGKYTIRQNIGGVPEGYAADPDAYDIVVGADATSTIPVRTYNEPVKASLTLSATDSTSGTKIPTAGTVFDVRASGSIIGKDGTAWYSNGDLITSVVTDDTGTATTNDDLPLGSYTISEQIAPYKYSYDSASNATVSATYAEYATNMNKVDNVVRKDASTSNARSLASFRVSKNDADSGRLVVRPGTEIEVRAASNITIPTSSTPIYEADDLVATVTTTEANGYYGIANSPQNSNQFLVGDYYLVEKTAPEGYILDSDTHYPASFVYEGQNSKTTSVTGTITDTARKGSVTFTITDGTSPLKVAGFKVQLYAAEPIVTGDGQTRYTTDQAVGAPFATNDEGVATMTDVDFGSYYLKMVEPAPAGYTIVDGTWSVSVSDTTPVGAVVSSISLADLKAKGEFVVETTDEDGNALSGATYSAKATTAILNPDGSALVAAGTEYASTTNASGQIIFEDLYQDATYEITQTTAPNGYVLAKPISAVLDGDSITVSFKNVPQKGTITVSKKDSSSDKLIKVAGAEFQVLSGSTVVDTIKTDASGKATTKALPLGSYVVKETKAPNGYLLSDDTDTVTLSYGDPADELVFEEASIEDTAVMGIISIDCVDSSARATQLATTWKVTAKGDIVTGDGEVYAKDGAVVDEIDTTTSGKATSKKLPLGTYLLTQTAQQDGYERSTTSHEAILSYKDQTTPTVTFSATYYNDSTDVSIKKIGSDGSSLPETEFVCWNPSDASKFTGFAAYSTDVITSAVVTRLSGMDNMTPNENTEIVLKESEKLSNDKYCVFASDEEPAKGAYVLTVSYVADDGKEYKATQRFHINEFDETAIFYVGDLGTSDSMRNKYDSTTSSRTNQSSSDNKSGSNESSTDETTKAAKSAREVAEDDTSSVIPSLAPAGTLDSLDIDAELTKILSAEHALKVYGNSMTTAEANKVISNYEKAASEIEASYTKNGNDIALKLLQVGDDEDVTAYKDALDIFAKFGEVVKTRMNNSIENYNWLLEDFVCIEIPSTGNTGLGSSELIINIVDYARAYAYLMGELNLGDVSVPTWDEIAEAVQKLGTNYVQDRPTEYSIEKSIELINKVAVTAQTLINKYNANHPDEQIDYDAEMVPIFNAAKNGDFESMEDAYSKTQNIFAALSSADAAELTEEIKDGVDSIFRESFVIHALKSEREELLTAPAGTLHRVPVILSASSFAVSAVDDQGIAEFKYLSVGKVGIAESRALDGYATNAAPMYATVNANGYVSALEGNDAATLNTETSTISMINQQTIVIFSKTAVGSDSELEGNTLSILSIGIDGEEKLIDTWVTDGEMHRIDGLAAGDYILKEDQPAQGYNQASEISFRVLDTEQPQRVGMTNSLLDAFVEAMGNLGIGLPIVLVVAAAGSIIGIVLYRRRRALN